MKSFYSVNDYHKRETFNTVANLPRSGLPSKWEGQIVQCFEKVKPKNFSMLNVKVHNSNIS